MSKAERTLLFALPWICFWACLQGGVAQAATFTGTVFEDVNYGGGAGRARVASGGVALQGVVVELYRASNNNFIASTTTNASGFYSLSSGNGSSYAVRVRVVNGSVRSSRPGGNTCNTCVPVQTFRMEGNGTSLTAVTDHVGGENPALPDAIANTTSASFSSLTSAGVRVPQSYATVTPSGSNVTLAGIDFGFNFDVVVNTRDALTCIASNSSYPCQGSLRQFLINATALGGEGSLSQSGSGQIDGSSSLLPGGFETSIFMIPDGTVNPGQHAGYASQLTGGVAAITLAGTLTTVAGTGTRIDASTQTVNVGNSNPGTVGSGGTVGVDALTLPAFQRPEVQLTAGNTTITLGGTSNAMVGFALRQGYILITGSGCLVRNNLVGMSATGVSGATDTGGLTHGITFTGSNATVRNNYVTIDNSGIRTDSGGMGALIAFNEVARPAIGHSDTFDGILLVGTVSSIQVTGNLARDQRGGGIELGFGGGAAATGIVVSNNSVRGNGFANVGGGAASSEPIGMVAYDYNGSGVVFSRNVVRDNAGPGILLMRGNGTQMTQNSFAANGGLSIDLDTRSVDPNTMNTLQGVTLNDLNDADSGPPNALVNFPVMVRASLVAGELAFAGFARPNSGIELYIAQTDPSGFGEGATYLGTFIEGSAADLDTGTGSYGPAAINGVVQGNDTTNRFSFRVAAPPGIAVGSTLTATATLMGETSEFGGNVVVTAGPALQVSKQVSSFSDPLNGAVNPKSIPGAVKLYVVQVANQGSGGVDNDSLYVIDKIPANTRMFVGDLGSPGSGPVSFVNGAPSSALTWTFTALNSTTDDLDFSNDGGATWTYVPVPDGTGADAAITDIRMRPKGLMPGQSSGSPSFSLQFRVLVN